MVRYHRKLAFVVIALILLVSPACSTGGLSPSPGESSTVTPPVDAIQISPEAETTRAVTIPTPETEPTRAVTKPATEAESTRVLTKTAPEAESTRTATKPAPEAEPTQMPLATLPQVSARSDVLNLLSGLENLDSYRMTYEMKVVGVDQNGNERIESHKAILENVNSKDSMHYSIQLYQEKSTLPGSEPLEIYQIGPKNYMYMVISENGQPTGICNSISSDDSELFMNTMLTPEKKSNIQLGNLIAKSEIVNGVLADQYQIKKADFVNGTATDISARVWVAQEGGYVVRFTGTAEGKFSITGPYLVGKMDWSYELSEIDSLEEIILPDSCRRINATT